MSLSGAETYCQQVGLPTKRESLLELLRKQLKTTTEKVDASFSDKKNCSILSIFC